MLGSGISSRYMVYVIAILIVGWIPSMLPFGLLSTLYLTIDPETLIKTVWWTAKAMFRSLLQGKI
jgi:ERG2 and Sigma1 receptor like protein